MNVIAKLLVVAILLRHGTSLEVVRKDSPAVLKASISRHPQRHNNNNDNNNNVLEGDRLRHEAHLSRMAKRAKHTLDLSLKNEKWLYSIALDVGSPPQPVKLHIDTGSSDMWVNIPSSHWCSKDGPRECAMYGTYNPDESSTATLVNNAFRVTYADGSHAAGSYITDKVTVGDVTIPSLQFGLGNSSSSEAGILGIGYELNEGAVRDGRSAVYSNFPSKLAQRGVINSNAYSLWLNDLEASTGSILFGGVDQAKYSGILRTLPVLQVYDVYSQLVIELEDVVMNGQTIRTPGRTPVLLDTGTSYTYLPTTVTDKLYRQLGLSYNSTANGAVISCQRRTEGTGVDFHFPGVTIHVPMKELVINIPHDSRCFFGIVPTAEASLSVLGDTFLRSAYVVYDLSNNEVSLAQTRPNVTAEDIVEIAASPHGVPDAKNAKNAVPGVVGQGKDGQLGIQKTNAGSRQHSTGALGFWMLLCIGFGLTTLRIS